MRTMTLAERAAGRLEATDRAIPTPGPGEILIAVTACGVCRTDLHVVDGELPDAYVLAGLRAGRLTGAAVLRPNN